MSSQKLLGLSPPPPALKSTLPFLLRAEELKKQEPIIAYWCAYYAAQVGINLKARDAASRDFLFNLLGVLEKMKDDIGSVDAIEVEAASAAYVENFALKLFNIADNEDRRGAANKITAKRFLAASNLLEVLKTFPKTDVAETNEEKVRYAKWKAADISKAIREGRKPVPGPAGQEINVDSQPSDHPSTAIPHNDGQNGSSNNIGFGAPPLGTKNAWVSEELEGKITPSTSPPRTGATRRFNESPEPKKSVHFTPSVVDQPPPIPPAPSPPRGKSPTQIYQGPSSIYSQGSRTPTPPNSIPLPSSGSSSGSPPREFLNPPPPPPLSNSPPRSSHLYVPPPSSVPSYPSIPPNSYPSAIPPSQPVDMTPAMISKAQKHCRFAISALDYEDVEQARRELRAALAIIGGL